jgi:hypothetical protein
MALLAPQTPVITGTTPTYSAVSASDTLKHTTDNSFLIVRNAGGSPDNVTVVVPGSKYGQATPDVTVAVPAGGERWVGPFKSDMVDPTSHVATVTHSFITSVTQALVTL